MRVTTKGQVTIPRHIREALGITPNSEVDFVRQEDGSYRLVKKTAPVGRPIRFARLRGVATVKMSTDEIMALTRGE
jgi:AbrB family looped-hinge helix DNA binding protein